MALSPPPALHPLLTPQPPGGKPWLVVVAVLLGTALLVGLVAYRPQAVLADTGLMILQGALVLLVFGAVFWASRQMRRWRQRAALALQAAADADDFWNEERLLELARSLFEPFWQGVASRDIAPVRAGLSAYWATRCDTVLGAWQQRNCRPFHMTLQLLDAAVVGLEDWLADPRDQVTVMMRAKTAFHVTELASGALVEGIPGMRDERQLWQFVRGDAGGLLNRVQILADGASGNAGRIIREEP